jgi:hypothetical protein
MRREQGSIIVLLLALLAAMALVTAAVARDGLQRRHHARLTYLAAVARNLAEGGITARRAVPEQLLGPGLRDEGLRGAVRLTRAALPGGRQRLVATAEVRTRRGDSMEYVIEATFERGRTVGWSERRSYSP